jgi:hypothetical protein
MYITQDDKDADKNSAEVAEKLAEIKAFTSSELVDISDEVEKTFNKLYKNLVTSRNKLYDIFIKIRIAKESHNEADYQKYQTLVKPILNELIDTTDEELIFRMLSLNENIKISSDKVVVKRSKQLLEISEQQFLLMVLLNVRTSIEPRLITDYSEYF